MNKQIAVFNPRRMMNEDLFESFFGKPINLNYNEAEIEMYEDDNNVVVKVKAPGFDENSIDIGIEDNVLTISGNVESDKKEEDPKKKYYYQEMRQESFVRSVSLPVKVKAEESNAEFKKGILEIKMPKADEVKPKKIAIKAKGE